MGTTALILLVLATLSSGEDKTTVSETDSGACPKEGEAALEERLLKMQEEIELLRKQVVGQLAWQRF